jgi:anti-sigma-K factor RskA
MSLDPTDPCAELQPQIAAYALGETEAAAELLEHLAECPACQRDLRAYVQVARMLPYDAPNVAPPPDLRARILSAVEESAAGIPAASPPVSPPESRRKEQAADQPQRARWLRPSFRLAFGLALVALVALLGWNITLQRQLRTQAAQIAASRANWQTMIVLLNDPAVRWYAVAGDTANGHFWATPQGKVACLVAQRLPAVRNDQVYQVWLVHGGEHTSGGVFEAREGNGWILIRSTEPLANYDFVGVTIEPRGGSAAPTSRPILQGEIAAAHTPTVADRQLLLSLIAPPGD